MYISKHIVNSLYSLQWWILRLSGLFLIPSFLLDLEIAFLLIPFILLHAKLGLKTILVDYIHNKKNLLLCLVLIRVLSLETLVYSLELIL